MATVMELDQAAHPFDWANDTYMALSDPACTSPEKWAAMSQPQPSMPPSAFTFPSTLLTESSIERFGQITPPADLSSSDQHREHDKPEREGSISVEQLHSELSWPGAQDIQALADYQPSPKDQPHQSLPSPTELSPKERAPKRRRTSKQSETNQSPPEPAPQHTTETPAQPQKRKRGRPKSQPQMAYTADGFPFQVSSTRQSHLEKNRVAAHKCRQRKKEYINGLEGRAREYSAKNKALKDNVAMLREEVLSLKNEVLRHAGCGFWAVDEYLARCAGDLLGVDRPLGTSSNQRQSAHSKSPDLGSLDNTRLHREDSIASLPSQVSMDSMDDHYTGFDLLEDIDDVED